MLREISRLLTLNLLGIIEQRDDKDYSNYRVFLEH